VTPPKPKRAAQAPRPRALVAARPPAPAVVQSATPPPAPLAVAGAAAEGLAESRPAPGALPKPPGQTITTVSGERIKNEPAFTVQDLLQESPGVSFKQGNGPRDIGISIRGSNARNGFGIRNIVVLEDGFSVTQPDGLSRTDLLDPHAYGGVDVYRGPASAMFGNYATGGAINFRLWRGDQINGARYGVEGGSFGYLNNYAIVGGRNEQAESTAFMSDVRGDGYISHSSFNTQTFNALGTYSLTPDDRITVKAIDNRLSTNLSTRLSLNQFQTNPLQRGCTNAATAAPGCATVALFANGFSAPTISQTADEAALGRHDTRNIAGIRWEHDFDSQTTWRTQGVFDDKNINQPTGMTSAIGDSPSYNLLTNLTQRGSFFGLDAVQFAEVFYARQRLTNYTWNVAPGGGLGALSSFYDGGHHVNWGGHFREEVHLAPSWIGYVAAGVESTTIAAVNTIFSFPGGAAVPGYFPIQRDFLNYAPEGGMLYRLNDAWQFRSRVATGYGTPQISNLTVTAQGVSGNNSQLASQTNVGIDVGTDWTPDRTLKLSVTGFYEFFRNELVTGFQLVKTPEGRVLRIADLVDDDPSKRDRVSAALKDAAQKNNRDHVDIIIALGMAKEGFDWIWCEHALTVGYRSSLTEIVQIIGRATRDAPGKTRARFTNLIAEPDASEETVTEAVNDTLKAIAASLLMEQVLAPRFEFKPKNPASGPVEGFDYGQGGYDSNKCNVGFNENTGQFQIEIKGLAEPKSKEAARICREDLNEVIAAFVQDKTAIERGIFDEELVPEELTQVRMGKIIKDKYPELDVEDQEAVRQHAIAALNLTQKAKQLVLEGEGAEGGGNTALIDGVRKFAMDVRELDIDLIDRINPFGEAYAILAKTMSEDRLKQVAAAIAAKRTSLTPEEAKELAVRAVKFKKERGRLPSISSPDAWEKRMAEGAAAFVRFKDEGRYE
jgi:outer membrane receptor protein involved in Fe transport